MSVLICILLVAFYLYTIGINLVSYLNYLTDMSDKLSPNWKYLTYKNYIKNNILLGVVNIIFKVITVLLIAIIIKTLIIKLIYGN